MKDVKYPKAVDSRVYATSYGPVLVAALQVVQAAIMAQQQGLAPTTTGAPPA